MARLFNEAFEVGLAVNKYAPMIQGLDFQIGRLVSGKAFAVPICDGSAMLSKITRINQQQGVWQRFAIAADAMCKVVSW